jgi:chloramphenicol 3-O phosphotransferase
MSAGKVIFINGSSSSGKTTILHFLQTVLEEPFLEVGIDKFIWMLPERYLNRPLWDDVLGLAEKAGETGHVLVRGMHHAIAALSESGINVLADHVLVDQSWVENCVNLFFELPAYLIGIHCPLDVLEEREKNRNNRTLGQARLQFPVIHKYTVYDLEADTSELTTDQCVRAILARIKDPPEAFKRLKRQMI